jgi:hypothetical protein
MSYLREACLLEDWISKHGHPDFNAVTPREAEGVVDAIFFFSQ